MIKFTHGRRHSLVFPLVVFVFSIMLVTGTLISFIMIILFRMGLVPFGNYPGFLNVMIIMLIMSVIVSTSLVALLGKMPLKPIRNLKNAAREIARGNFNVRVEVDGITELGELAMDFNAMATELASVDTIRNDFINEFSHEFKTPIVSIRGFAKLLKKDNLTREERNEYLNIIIEESSRLTQLSTNVLTLAKLDSQGIITSKTMFSLDEQIRRIILVLQPSWEKKQIQFSVEMDEVSYHGNEELLKQVWLNILDNAVKFTPEKGLISVIVRNLGNEASVDITDNGIGMDSETISHIFTKFYQGDKSRTIQGNGLGLALVERILHLHGSTIAVTSEPGQGTRFTVRLPHDI